jgi:hypothetical protein
MGTQFDQLFVALLGRAADRTPEMSVGRQNQPVIGR